MLAVDDLHLIVSSPHDKLLRKAIETVYKAYNVDIRTFDFENSTYSDIDDLLLHRVPTNVIDFNPTYFCDYLEKTIIETLDKLDIWVVLPTDVSLCDRLIASLAFAIDLKIPIYFFLPQSSHVNWNAIVAELSVDSHQIIKKNQRKSLYFTPINFNEINHLAPNGIYTSLIRSTYRRPQVLSSKILELLRVVSMILKKNI
jgi:hypothetical protein